MRRQIFFREAGIDLFLQIFRLIIEIMNQSKNNQFEMNLFSTLNKALNILQNLQNKFHTKNYISPSNLKKNTIQQDNKITQSVF